MPGPSYLVLKPNDSFGILIYLLSKDVSWFCMMIFANSFTLRVFTTKNFCLRHIFNTMSCSYPLYYYYLKMFFGSVATTIFTNSFNVFTTTNFCLTHIFNMMSCSYPFYYYLKMSFGSVATTIFANSFNAFTTTKFLSKAYFQYDVVFIPFSTTI